MTPRLLELCDFLFIGTFNDCNSWGYMESLIYRESYILLNRVAL